MAVPTGVLFVFTVLLSCFFDAMGTIMGVSDEAKLTDAQGQMPGINKVLFVDGLAVAAGGASSSSATTAFVESTAGVGEGARTGFANVVTGGLFAVALFLTPVATMVPSQAATPALLAVGFMILANSVRDIDWADWTIAVPAFVTMVMMPFTYSITNGIGMGFITFVVLRLAAGRANILMAVGSLAGALLAARRGTAKMRVLVVGAVAFGTLEIVAAIAPSLWLFALLMAPIGMFGMTVNVTGNTSVQMGTDPAMRGRVMSLYMMVFMGGSPIGAPIAGWITDAYGVRAGLAVGGAIAAAAAVTVGLVLARVGNLRLSVGWNRGHPQVRFVPREAQEQLAAAA